MPPDPAPTAEDFFGPVPAGQPPRPPPPGNDNTPTAAEFFAPPQPQAGPVQDTIWSNLAHAGTRILNATGFGYQNAWGDRPVGLDPDADKSLRDAGVLPDYNKGNADFFKSANEAVLRPSASAVDVTARFLPSAAAAIEAGAKQTVEEIEGKTKPGLAQEALALPVRVVGGLASGVTQGAFPDLPELSAVPTRAAVAASEAERLTTAVTARSVGVLGEGEPGFYEAEPVSPENAAARTAAAQDAGLDRTPTPPQPAPDIHTLARRIDPDTFDQYDALAAERDQHRAAIEAMGAERQASPSPEAIQAKAQIDMILGKVNGVESRLTNAARERLADAQSHLDDLTHTDTPEMAAAHGKLLQADYSMRELAPEVSAAYRQAREMAPQLPIDAPVVAPETPAAEAERPATPGEPTPAQALSEGRQQAAGIAEEESKAPDVETAPASVTGTQTLGEAGGAEPAGEPAPGTKPSLARYGNLRAVEGTGETRARGLSEHVEESAVADGLTTAFGDLPEYEQLSMADQAAQAQKLIGDDYESAKDVALGIRAPPKGLLPESVFVAVEKQALADGDVETLRQLATNSRLTTTATTMGQRIRALGERDAASPVGAIQKVQQAREAAQQAALAKTGQTLETAKAEVAEQIRDEVRNTAQSAKPSAWADFISALKCEV